MRKRVRIMALETMFMFLIYVMAMSTASCNKKIPVHTGAVSNLDSYSYDILLVEQSTLNQAVASYKAGTLPANAKDSLNAAINQYNVAQGAWQSYHAGGGNATVLQQAINALIGAVGQLQQALGVTPAQITTRN